MHGLRRYLFGVVASLFSSLCFGDWMSFSCTVTVGAAGEGGKPRIRGIVTQVPSAPGFFGHAIDLGSVVAWSSGVAGSSHTLYQVCWRSGVWCCKPFGYGPYCLHPSGCPMDISAVGLSVECTLQKVTLDSVVFLALMFGGFFLPSVRQERGAGGSVTGYVSTRDLLTFYTARSKPISYMLEGEISI